MKKNKAKHQISYDLSNFQSQFCKLKSECNYKIKQWNRHRHRAHEWLWMKEASEQYWWWTLKTKHTRVKNRSEFNIFEYFPSDQYTCTTRIYMYKLLQYLSMRKTYSMKMCLRKVSFFFSISYFVVDVIDGFVWVCVCISFTFTLKMQIA